MPARRAGASTPPSRQRCDALLDDARGPGRMIRRSRQGIGLEDAHPVAARDQELVANARADARAEQLPHPRAAEGAHRPGARVPEVGVAHHADAERIRRPDAECGADDALVLDDASAEDAPELGVRAFADQVEVELAEGRREPVRILLLPLALVVAEADPVAAVRRREQSPRTSPRRLAGASAVTPSGRATLAVVASGWNARIRIESPVARGPSSSCGSRRRPASICSTADFELGRGRDRRTVTEPAPRSRKRSGIGTQAGR